MKKLLLITAAVIWGLKLLLEAVLTFSGQADHVRPVTPADLWSAVLLIAGMIYFPDREPRG